MNLFRSQTPLTPAEPPKERRLFFCLYAAAVLAQSAVFHHYYVTSPHNHSVKLFSAVFIPLLTLFCHLLLFFVFPRILYALIILANFIAQIGLASYHNYFNDNFTFHQMIGNAKEMSVCLPILSYYVSERYIAVGAFFIAIQWVMAVRIDRRSVKKPLAFLAAAILPTYLLGLTWGPSHDSTSHLRYNTGVNFYGYYAAMLADTLSVSENRAQTQRLEELASLQLTDPVEKLNVGALRVPDFDGILAIQVESLDYNVLDHQSSGKWVAPFLTETSRNTLFLKLDPHHAAGAGSSGADFQLLTGLLPLADFPIYRLPHLDFKTSLPALFARQGIRSFAYHGNSGANWARSWNFRKMGFARFYDLLKFPRADTSWGLSDGLFLSESLKLLQRVSGKTGFHFFITMSSHGPFTFVKNPVFQENGSVGNYFNSVNYVDKALEDFLHKLPGRYLVVIYGDHCAMVENDNYSSVEDGKERVPGLAFVMDNGRLLPIRRTTENPRSEPTYDIRTLHYFILDAFNARVKMSHPTPRTALKSKTKNHATLS